MPELREVAIWYTEAAVGALFDIERFVLSTGRRAFIEVLRFGRIGRAARRLRYDEESPAAAGRLADAIWSDLLRRARRQGIRMPPLLSASAIDGPPGTSRFVVAQRFVERVHRREVSNLVAAGLYGSVATGDDRRHSDIDLILVLRHPRGRGRFAVSQNCLVSIGNETSEGVREELTRSPWNLPEVLSGWRSMRILYDPSGLLRRAVAQSTRPSDRMWRRAALANLLEGHEDLGKLFKAARAGDVDETREMAIWFSEKAMLAFLCLEHHVVTTGRRLLAETRSLGPLGRRIFRLRTESRDERWTLRLAESVWASLIVRARRDGVRLPIGLDSVWDFRDTS